MTTTSTMTSATFTFPDPDVTTYCDGEHLAVRVRQTGPSPMNPLNLAFLIDVSHSMGENHRLNRVKQTLYAIRTRNLWSPTDRVTLVTFSKVATTCCDHLVMDAVGIDTLYHLLDALEPDSATDLGAGLERLQLVQRPTDPFDAILLLTDGNVTSGLLRTNTSLCAVATAVGSLRGETTPTPFHVLGYGADHNRKLSRDLAVQSRGTYTYVDNAEILPVAMGDILSGARAEVFRGATVAAGEGWLCDSDVAPYALGGIIPDRDYWVLFKRSTLSLSTHPVSVHITLVCVTATGSRTLCHTTSASVSAPEESLILLEQVFHSRLTHALVTASNCIETTGTWNRALLEELLENLSALPREQQSRPKLLAVREQAEDMLRFLLPPTTNHTHPPQHHHGIAAARLHIAARMSSAAAIYSTQRGVQMGSEILVSGDPAPISSFASPMQRGVSTQMYDEYKSMNPT